MKRPLATRTGRLLSAALLCLVSACSVTRVGIAVPARVDEPLLKGPAVVDVVTPFDRALSCLDGRINREVLRFSVGSVIDATGKEQVTDGGSGKFVTQGAGDIVQSALFLAGAAVVNRRDPRIIDNEAKWGLLDVKQQAVSTFFVTGSINSTIGTVTTMDTTINGNSNNVAADSLSSGSMDASVQLQSLISSTQNKTY